MDLMQRLHIIDGCQASDLSVAAKYERNFGNGAEVKHVRDGASFQRIFGIRPHLETPAVGIQRLVLWAVTTLLFGNSDAHGKNISFHVGRAGLNVAELYDLVSVTQYDASKLEHTLAMAFGDVFDIEEVKSFALADFCVRCGINRSFFARELETLCNIALEHSALQAQDPVYRGHEQEFVRLIASLINQRAGALKVMAKEISSYKNDLF
jgi:serine/threonine-protein kinase HipA